MKKIKGFTLVELLVVISIISILSSVVLTSLSYAKGKARDAIRHSDTNQILKAFELYRQDHDGNLPRPSDFGCSDNSWYCLGHAASGGACWSNVEFSAGFSGCSGLNTALNQYLNPIPDDPQNDTTHFGDAYLYDYNLIDGGVTYGTVLHWGMEKSPLTSSDCYGGTAGQWASIGGGGKYFCLYQIR